MVLTSANLWHCINVLLACKQRHGDHKERPIFQTYYLKHLNMLLFTFIEVTYLKATFRIKKQVVPFFNFLNYLAIWIWLSSLLMLLSLLPLLSFFERNWFFELTYMNIINGLFTTLKQKPGEEFFWKHLF